MRRAWRNASGAGKQAPTVARRTAKPVVARARHFGLVVLKDMGSILSMRADNKAEVLAALREIYDGSWTRYVGADGGRSLHWQGKVGLLAGATPVLDRHHTVSPMGESFLRCRLPESADTQAEQALAHSGHAEETCGVS
jgi:hypothetical protein